VYVGDFEISLIIFVQLIYFVEENITGIPVTKTVHIKRNEARQNQIKVFLTGKLNYFKNSVFFRFNVILRKVLLIKGVVALVLGIVRRLISFF
jgi:hypothetical protein